MSAPARRSTCTPSTSTRRWSACCGRSGSTATGRAPRAPTSTTRTASATSTGSAASACSTSAGTTPACATGWSRRWSCRRRTRRRWASRRCRRCSRRSCVRRAPASIGKALFTSSGTESVEAAIKLGRAATGARACVCVEHAFHGLTLGSLSVNGEAAFTDRFGPLPAGLAACRSTTSTRWRRSCAARTSRSSSSSRCSARA